MQSRLPERPTEAPGFTLPIFLAASLLAAGCSKDAAQAQVARPAGDDAVLVTVAPVVKKAMPLEIRVIGTAEAESTVAVHVSAPGSVNEPVAVYVSPSERLAPAIALTAGATLAMVAVVAADAMRLPSETSRVTVYVPLSAYTWLGVAPPPDEPSPKVHA